MNCPHCGQPMAWKNQDFVSHGWYCLQGHGWLACDKECCQALDFGAGASRLPASGSHDQNSGRASANEGEQIDRRNRDKKPRPDMIWSDRHQMWADPDTRSPEEKARHEKIASDVESRIRKEGDSK